MKEIPDAGWDNPAPIKYIEIGLWDWPDWLKKVRKMIKHLGKKVQKHG
jgi:hypothetical protein